MSSTLASQERVSVSAYDCAAVRAAVHAYTGCESFDYLAADIARGGSCSLRARAVLRLVRLRVPRLALALAERVTPGVEVFLFARCAVGDDQIREALAEDATTQVVVLGAGLDTSGLRIDAERRQIGLSPGVFFEVDLPATQIEKQQQVARLLRARPSLSQDHIVYVPCSFGEHQLVKALQDAGFQPSTPVMWVWSGVTYYLPEPAVRSTLADLRMLSTRGSRLFFDYVLLEAYENPDLYAFRETKARVDSFGESLLFGLRAGRERVSGWLTEQGLEFVRSYTNLDMVDVYEAKTGMKARSAGTPWANLCVARF